MTTHRAQERYLPEHLREALLTDERVGEQDLQVWADAHCIHVAGSVPTQARREAITSVIDELAPGWEVCNDVVVVDVVNGPDVETIS